MAAQNTDIIYAERSGIPGTLTAKDIANLSSYIIPNSGRFYCYTNNRWVTDSDDNYGGNNFQFNENCGTGAEPLIEWEHMGILVPKNNVIKKLLFAGKSNNNQVTDLEIRIVIKTPNPISRWETGMDNDSEDSVQTLYSGFYKTSSMTAPMNDFMRREIDLNNFQVIEDSMLSIYLRPVGTITSTRYFRATWSWELSNF